MFHEKSPAVANRERCRRPDILTPLCPNEEPAPVCSWPSKGTAAHHLPTLLVRWRSGTTPPHKSKLVCVKRACPISCFMTESECGRVDAWMWMSAPAPAPAPVNFITFYFTTLSQAMTKRNKEGKGPRERRHRWTILDNELTEVA